MDFIQRKHVDQAISEYDSEYPNNNWRPNGPNGIYWYKFTDKYYWCIYPDEKPRPLKEIFFRAANLARPGYFQSSNEFNTAEARMRGEELGYRIAPRIPPR